LVRTTRYSQRRGNRSYCKTPNRGHQTFCTKTERYWQSRRWNWLYRWTTQPIWIRWLCQNSSSIPVKVQLNRKDSENTSGSATFFLLIFFVCHLCLEKSDLTLIAKLKLFEERVAYWRADISFQNPSSIKMWKLWLGPYLDELLDNGFIQIFFGKKDYWLFCKYCSLCTTVLGRLLYCFGDPFIQFWTLYGSRFHIVDVHLVS